MKSTKLSFSSRLQVSRKPNPETGCIEWTSTTDGKGYGIIHSKGKNIYVHRYIYEQYKGTIPAGLGVLHTCNNSLCSNPDHLYAGTPKQNMRDMHNAGRGITAYVMHSITEEQYKILANPCYSQAVKQQLTGLSKGTVIRAIPVAREYMKNKKAGEI